MVSLFLVLHYCDNVVKVLLMHMLRFFKMCFLFELTHSNCAFFYGAHCDILVYVNNV